MTAILTWIFSLGLGLGLLELTRQAQLFGFNTAIALAISVNLALLAMGDIKAVAANKRAASQQAVTIIWMLALIWAWLVFATLVLHSSVTSFQQAAARLGGLAGASLLSGCFAALLNRSVKGRMSGISWLQLLRLSRMMAAMQLVAGVILVLMMLSSGMMSGIRADWAGNNALFFGTLALIAVATQAVLTLSEAISLVSRPSEFATTGLHPASDRRNMV